jgi:hypothetical protein
MLDCVAIRENAGRAPLCGAWRRRAAHRASHNRSRVESANARTILMLVAGARALLLLRGASL